MGPRQVLTIASLLAALALAACGGSSTTSSSSSQTVSSTASSVTTTTTGTASGSQNGLSYEGIPLEVGPFIAPANTTGTATVDRIHCAPTEQLVYHIHAHLAVFLDGRLYALPAGVGIPGSRTVQTSYGPVAIGGYCLYWLHTHSSDGVIHVESPTARVYTLGDFFDEWRQPLSSDQVGGLHGKITAYFNGKPWTQSLRAIPLLPHALIQFDIGDPTPPLVSVDWKGTGL